LHKTGTRKKRLSLASRFYSLLIAMEFKKYVTRHKDVRQLQLEVQLQLEGSS
jgi:hypothetical protein